MKSNERSSPITRLAYRWDHSLDLPNRGSDKKSHYRNHSNPRPSLAFRRAWISEHTESQVMDDDGWPWGEVEEEVYNGELEDAMSVLKREEKLTQADILDHFLPILARRDVMGEVNKKSAQPKFRAFIRIDGEVYELTFKKATAPNE